MRYYVTLDEKEYAVTVLERAGGQLEAQLEASDGTTETLPAQISRTGAGDWVLHLGTRVFDLVMAGTLPDVELSISGRSVSAKVESERLRAASLAQRSGVESDGVLKSPMPGKVVKVMVAEGDAIEAGQPVVVVEAMKMENELTAPATGTVSKVFVAEGDAVEGGAKLLTVDS